MKKKVPYRLENVMRKGELLVTSNFSFSHNVFLSSISLVRQNAVYRGYLFFLLVKDQNLFHRVDTIGNIFMSGTATRENITDGVHEMK